MLPLLRTRCCWLDAGAHAPLIKGALILLLVHGVIDVLIVVPAGRARRRRLRLAQDAGDVLNRLCPQRNPEGRRQPASQPGRVWWGAQPRQQAAGSLLLVLPCSLADATCLWTLPLSASDPLCSDPTPPQRYRISMSLSAWAIAAVREGPGGGREGVIALRTIRLIAFSDCARHPRQKPGQSLACRPAACLLVGLGPAWACWGGSAPWLTDHLTSRRPDMLLTPRRKPWLLLFAPENPPAQQALTGLQ